MIPLFLFFLISNVYPLNILIWNPVIGQSHVNFLGNIGDVLHRSGHNVTVISPVYDESLKPFGTKENVTKILVKSKKGKTEKWDLPAASGAIWQQSPSFFHWDDLEEIWEKIRNMTRDILEDENLIQSLSDSKCDVGIFEALEMSSVAAMELFGCRKFAVASAFGEFSDYHTSITGIPQLTSFTPSFMTSYSDRMSFYERFINWKLMIEGIIALNKQERQIQELVEKYRPGFPNLHDTMLKKTGIILSNSNEFTESPRLRTNMIEYVGGSNVYEKPLSEEAASLLSLRNRTVLFSLGSFAKSCHMPIEVKKAFAEAFLAFPDVTFIWKYEECVEKEFDKNSYKNIEFSNWVPQNELLNDERLVLFITHAGMNSILEAGHSGTPMITIPIFADQMVNSNNAVERGIALKLDRTEISKDKLVALITEMIKEDSSIYRERALNMKRILSGRPQLYRQKIVDWVERIANVDGPIEHLPLQLREMTWFTILSLDIVAFLSVLCLSVVGFVIFIIRKLINVDRGNVSKVKKN